jgi:DNA-binding MurR/RpiR family transcriptional regulator
MQQTLDALFKVTPTLTPKLQCAAKVILDNPNWVATMSMRALAGRAGVAPPTMIRLANALGFESYDRFKQGFQESVNEQNFEHRANWLQNASATDGIASIVHSIAEAGLGNVNHFYQELDLERVCEAADMIVNAAKVYVVASGGLHWIASYLHYVGKMAVPQMQLPGTSGNGLVEELIPVEPDDVILTMAYHPYSSDSIEASKFALAQGARMIYLTDSKAAPLASQAEVLLLQKTASPQFFPSMVSVMSAIETLIAVIVARSGDNAIENIARYSQFRKESGFYLD